MAARTKSEPDWPEATQAHCFTAIELLEHDDYRGAAERLRDARTACAAKGDRKSTEILDKALRMCLACGKSQVAAKWHGRAHAQIEARELDLRQELNTILSAISGHDANDFPPKSNRLLEALGIRPGRLGLRANHTLGWRSWSRRIRALLRQSGRPFGQRHERDQSPSLVEAPPKKSSASSHPPTGYEMEPSERCESRPRRKTPPPLLVYCLGAFQVYQGDEVVGDWPNSKSKSVFKYLIAHRDRPVPKEVLMEAFWPDASAGRARNSLNVAIYRIRRALSERGSYSYILFKNDCYMLNPELDVWVDFEEFAEHIDNARAMEETNNQSSVIQEYRAAEALYGGEFLEEDRYEEWLLPSRERLQDDYLRALDRLGRKFFESEDYDACVSICNKILVVDPCQEDAHRLLMRCHSRQKRPNLATRQFHLCVKALERELGVEPSRQTIELDERIRNHEAI
ncbi:MAG: BTAD domain-containing putative transcriptional regulator [Rubricoccaceae bacterium]|nr:BTAD domain-containing putative transcriptional regulator [Rubricoccaceae bacterium]